MSCEVAITMEGRKRMVDEWFSDSRATYHMISRREWFHIMNLSLEDLCLVVMIIPLRLSTFWNYQVEVL